MFVLAMSILIPSSLAQTKLTTTWSGSGNFYLNFIAGDDANISFTTSGDSISGNAEIINYEDNPYNYKVDTVSSKIRSEVYNGFIEYFFNRTDSYEPMYGKSGQQSYTYVEGNHATFDWSTRSNFANLRNCNYGFKNNDQITADGNFLLIHGIYKGNYGAEIYQEGSGSTKISSMSEEYGEGFKFGKGCGCYTNAKVESTGSGLFSLTVSAPSHIKTDFGIEMGGGTLIIQLTYNNSFNFTNFALEGG